MPKYDFEGWATKFNVKCADGRTIRPNAFTTSKRVPLVWMHQHGSVMNVLGHADLEPRDEGVWAKGTFNDTEQGQAAKKLVKHGDITGLSIWANHLRQTPTKDVLHGDIKELSLVLAGANPEATIVEDIISHSEDGYDEYDGNIMNFFPLNYISHGEDDDYDEDNEDVEDDENEDLDNDNEDDDSSEDDVTVEHADTSEEDKKVAGNEKTVQDVIDTMNEEQQNVMNFLIGKALEDGSKEGGDEMKHSAFDNTDYVENEDVLTHDDMMAVLGDVKRYGSLKESALAHGIENLEVLFPDAKAETSTPEFIKRDMGWVDIVMNGVHKVPFSRIKSLFADITEDEARAKGYIKGNYKKEEVFSLLKRTTQPTTIYKKQKFDRDDLVDIDFDAIPWIKQEMRMMLNEEIARAILVGDGRLASDDDKIDENCIRPIWKAEDLFAIHVALDANVDMTDPDAVAKNFIRKDIKSRKDYKGSGNPILFTTEDMLTDMLLLTDNDGRDLYDSEDKLRTKLRVSNIVTVPVMEGLTREVSGQTKKLLGIIVNLSDYSYGADKGGAVALFDDFDIDYNQQKYLIETRGSGSLTKPFSAIIIEANVANG